METRKLVWKDTAQNYFGSKRNIKIIKPTVVIIIIWFIAMGSLLGIHFFFKKKHQINKTAIMKIDAKFKSLNDEQKTKMRYFESGIIQLADGNLYIVGSGFEEKQEDLIRKRGLSVRKIEFLVEDPLFLERRMMINEALKTLNNAEKRCVTDRHAVIIHQDGAYYLVFDPKIYMEYVSKYGTECNSCEDKKRNQKNNLNERRKAK